jgi:YesN/AraC family two-component response regulator
VAEAVSLSPTYFSKIWNEEMKCRFTAYLNKLRIERARVLLRTTDTALVEIAGLLGYEDQSYFNKVFKKMVGLSPGRFRESAGRGPKIAEIHE